MHTSLFPATYGGSGLQMLLQLMQSSQATGAGQNVPSATDSQGDSAATGQAGSADAGGSQAPSAPTPSGGAASQFALQTLASLLNYQQAQPTSTNVASQLIGQLDTSGDGQLSLAEIEKALGATSSDQIAGLTQAFNQVDSNGDGEISQSELAAAISKSEQDGSTSGVTGWQRHHHHHGGGAFGLARNIIDQLDTSGTGALTLADIQAALGPTPSTSQPGSSTGGSSDTTGSASTTSTSSSSGSGSTTGSSTTGSSDGTSSTASTSGSGATPSSGTLAQEFASLDTNGDGQISISELASAIQSFRHAMEASWSSAWSTEQARFSTAA
jgi:Ca2+-binding EF-hand superfamily protein